MDRRAGGGDRVGARTTALTRSRFAEDRFAAPAAPAASAARSTDRYVLLGAGPDTFAYRSALADRVRVVEVDHPAVQRCKRDLLAAAGIAVPPGTGFVPVDLGRDGATARSRPVEVTGRDRGCGTARGRRRLPARQNPGRYRFRGRALVGGRGPAGRRTSIS